MNVVSTAIDSAPGHEAAEKRFLAVILSMDSPKRLSVMSETGCAVGSWRSHGSASYKRRVGSSCSARAQDSSRGQRPRKSRRSCPDPEGVALPSTAGLKTGVTPPGFDPFRVGSGWGTFSGGVAPGYCIDPLRGSRAEFTPRASNGLGMTTFRNVFPQPVHPLLSQLSL